MGQIIVKSVLSQSGEVKYIVHKIHTEAKRCFATHDEDIDYFNMRIYITVFAFQV